MNKTNLQGNSEFTKAKLQRQYQPKLKVFKNQILRTEEHNKLIQSRVQLEKQEQLVTSIALECFKKGQLIEMDWKTKTNFRKSELKNKLPKLNTEPNHHNNSGLPQPIDLYSHNPSQRSQSLTLKSSKDSLSINQKCLKLQQLLSPSKKLSLNHKKPLVYVNEEESWGCVTPKKLFKSVKFNSKVRNENESLEQYSEQGIHIAQKSKVTAENSKNKQNNIISKCVHLNSQSMANPSSFSQLPFQKLRSHTQTLHLTKPTPHSPLSTVSYKQLSVKQVNTPIPQTNSKQQQHNNRKVPQNYDILNDPNIYMVISKSRDRIINFKERLSLDSLSQIQKLKQLESVKLESIRKTSMSNNKKCNMINENSCLSDKGQNQLKLKIAERIDSLKNQKLPKVHSHVFVSTEKYLKTTPSEQGQMSYLTQAAEASQGKVSLIRTKKRKTLVQVQQKLLKRVKLSFLKQDLTRKFQQIRNYQHQSNISSIH